MKALVLKGILGLLACLALPGLALGAPAVKVRSAISSLSANHSHLWVADEQGYFRKYGLEVPIVFISSGTTVIQSLLAGELEVASMASDAALSAVLEGAPITIFATTAARNDFMFFVGKEIRTLGDLKGKRVGVTRFGAASDGIALAIMAMAGLRPDRDVVRVQMGGLGEILVGLRSGALAGGGLVPPFTVLARRLGLRAVYDFLEAPETDVFVVLVAKTAWLRDQRDVALRYLRAASEGIHFILSQPDPALYRQILTRRLRLVDQEMADEIAARMLKLYSHTRIPRTSLEGLRPPLGRIPHPRAKTADPTLFADNSLVEALEREGFYQRLSSGGRP
ncbi:MAG: ABC transporter substrate-binding protein [Deltaproteobacteria bacterium]|nr:ABC transporter substrate-binding protein [Deltaproteobacteria bacterium]MBI3077469.1 ABC transporter substrate-binding protein [Deltaproteobacteria bacterium]